MDLGGTGGLRQRRRKPAVLEEACGKARRSVSF